MMIRNAIRTPDGTILESNSRHDYKSHIDTTNGHTYIVDGGLDYRRRSVGVPYEELSVSLDDSFEKVREALTWGSRGINGDQPLTQIRLCDMTTDHIRAVLRACPYAYPQVLTAMKQELEHRGV
jgi:hypothetical protein